ncbi:MAG: DUF4132 domain-containing protein [Tannerellaceae bacterium]|nr:DUF4132 domain-containing protein [Tannerellaceae bacterium]
MYYKETIRDLRKLSVEALTNRLITEYKKYFSITSDPILREKDFMEALHLLCQRDAKAFFHLTKRVINDKLQASFPYIGIYCSYGHSYDEFPGLDEKIINGFIELEKEKFGDNDPEKTFTFQEAIKETYICPTAVLYDYSPVVQNMWKLKAETLSTAEKIQHIIAFITYRDTLRTAHIDSLRTLLDMGWKLPEIFMAYLNPGPDDRVVIDPDAIGVLVDEYPEEATRLLDPKQFDKYFQFRMHLSYKKIAYENWFKFLYRYHNFRNYTPVEQGLNHRLQKIRDLCSELMEEKDRPDISFIRFEQDLKQQGLKRSNCLPEKAISKKEEKERFLLLMQLYISGYQYSMDEFQNVYSENLINRQLATNLCWGIYEKDKLKQIVTLDDTGSLINCCEQKIEWPEKGNIRLIHPATLDKSMLQKPKNFLKTER